MELPDYVNEALITITTQGFVKEAKAFTEYLTVLERELDVAKAERDRYREDRARLRKLPGELTR